MIAPILAAIAIAACAAGAAPAHAAPDDGRLATETARFLSDWRTRRPALAVALGDPQRPPVAVPPTPAARARDLAILRGAERRLAAIPEARLSREARVDRSLLLARIEAERLLLADGLPGGGDPAAGLDEAASAIGATLAAEAPSPCERLTRATRGLRVVPELIRAARVAASDPPRARVERAIDRLERAAQVWRRGLAPHAGACRDPRWQADFAVADSAAVSSAEAAAAALRADALPRSTDGPGLGAAALGRWLHASSDETSAPDSLLSRALRELDVARADLARDAERVAPGAGVRPTLDALAADTTAADAAVRAVIDSMRARGMVLDARRRAAVEVHRARAWWLDGAPVRLVAPGARDGGRWDARLDVDPDLAAAAGPWAAACLAVREGPAGRGALARAAQRWPSAARQAFAGPAAIEGWCDWAAGRAIARGDAGGDPRLALAWRAFEVRRLGRAIVELSIHGRGMRRADAETFLAEWCWLAADDARREARDALAWPDGLPPVLGRWRLDDLEQAARERHGPAYDAAAFEEAVCRAGIPALARAQVLDGAMAAAGDSR